MSAKAVVAIFVTSVALLGTPAPAPSAPTGQDGRLLSSFVALGDSGGGDHQLAVARAMERWVHDGHRVDAIVSTGDNVAPDGAPTRYAAELDAPYAGLRRNRPFWVTLGNHDERDGNGPGQLTHLGLPQLPYEKHLSGVTLLFLDSHTATAEGEWLENHLRRSRRPFEVVVVHHPPYTCLPHEYSAEMDREWRPALDRHRTPLVLSGHDHMYERFVSPRGTNFVVTGGGGRELHVLGTTCPSTVDLVASHSVHHFTYVRVYERAMHVRIVGEHGQTIDAFRIAR